MKNYLILGALVIAILGAGGFWYLSNQTSQPQDEPTGDEIVMTDENTSSSDSAFSPIMDGDEPEAVNYALELNSYSFTPNLIEAEAGETIRIKLTSIDMPHNFVIDELNVQSGMLSAGGDSDIIEITIPEDTPSGTEYEFYCSVGNHKQLGMVGTLRVR